MINEKIENFLHADPVSPFDVINTFESLYAELNCICPILSKKEEISETADFIIECLADEEPSLEVKQALAYCLWLKDKEEECYEILIDLIQTLVDNDILYSLLGTVSVSINPKCLQHAEHAVRLKPTIRNTYVLARVYRTDRFFDIKKSTKIHDYLFSKKPHNNCAYKHFSNVLKKKNFHEEAIRYYLTAVFIEFELRLISNLIECCLKVDDLEMALAITEYYIQVQPSNIEPKLAKVSILISLGDFDSAYAVINKLDVTSFTQGSSQAMEYVKIKNELIQAKVTNLNKLYNNGNLLEFINEFGTIIGEQIPEQDLVKKYINAYLNVYGDAQEINADNNIYKFYVKGLSYEGNNASSKKLKSNIQKMSKFTLHNTFHFGKHNGKSVKDVVHLDGDYILYCIINLAFFYVDNIVFLNSHLQKFPYYTKALEYNLIKEKFYHDKIYVEPTYSSFYSENRRPSYSESLRDALGGQMDASWNID